MADAPLRVAVVGAGRCAQDHLQAYQRLEEVQVVAVVDTQPEVAQRVAEQYGCRAYTTCEAMLEAEHPQAITICTPPVTHAPLMRLALQRGVHVLCEKPLTINLSDAKDVLELARVARVTLMMASKFRFVEDVVTAKGLMESGVIGRPVMFENVFCSMVDMRARWNARKAIAGGGVLFDNGTHSVDIARFLLGPIVSVQAQHGIQIQDLEVEDTCRLAIQSASGVMGHIDVSWSLQKDLDSFIHIYGTEGTLVIGWRESKYRLTGRADWVVFGQGYNKQRAFLGQLRHFVRCVRGEDAPLLTPLDGLESVRVIEAAYRSSAVNKWQALEPLEERFVHLHGAR